MKSQYGSKHISLLNSLSAPVEATYPPKWDGTYQGTPKTLKRYFDLRGHEKNPVALEDYRAVTSMALSEKSLATVGKHYPQVGKVENLDQHEASTAFGSVLSKWNKAQKTYTTANRFAMRYQWRTHRYKVSKYNLRKNQRGAYFRRPDLKLRNRLWFRNQRKTMPAIFRVKVTGNNIIMSVRALGGRTLLTITGGGQGLARRKGPVTTQKMYDTILRLRMRAKVNRLYIEKDGPGVFMKSFIYTLRKSNIRVRGIADITPQAHNGTRPKAPRRV